MPLEGHEQQGMQDVAFREPDLAVSFRDYAWLTHYTAADSAATTPVPSPSHIGIFAGWPWFATAPEEDQPPGGSPESTRSMEDDVVVTLNLPLLGVLRTIDQTTGPLAGLAQAAVQTYFQNPELAGKFDGLFMRRCAALLGAPW
jgi:hypothetical protein